MAWEPRPARPVRLVLGPPWVPEPIMGPQKEEGARGVGVGASQSTAGGYGGVAVLTLGALGIVFGDIGTSPLYAFREVFEGHDLTVTHDGVVGACSLVFWALVVVISIKYLSLVMRADNKGEGGILALTSLLDRATVGRVVFVLTGLGVFGTALLYGDGMITPAISVLSAVEGMGVATSALRPWMVEIA